MPEVMPDGLFNAIPKVDIHCHLYGTIRAATLKEFARDAKAPMTDAEIDGFYVRGEKPRGVLHAFRFMEEHILGHTDRLYRLTYECLEDMKAGNVHYVELFWNATGTLHHNPDLSYEAAQDSIISAMRDAEIRLGLRARLIPAIDRQASPEDAVELVEDMIAHRDDMAIGLGIDYLETGHPPEGFWKAYKLAKEAGFRTTAHAGEFGCHWRNVETSLRLLDVDRLDHCYSVIENERLFQELIDKQIVVTVVPTNSYFLRTLDPSQWATKHPIREMARRGLKIHPNTDDPTFHNVTPALVWKMMQRDFGCTLAQLKQFMINGLDGAWIDDASRSKWKKRFAAEFDAAVSEFSSGAN